MRGVHKRQARCPFVRSARLRARVLDTTAVFQSGPSRARQMQATAPPIIVAIMRAEGCVGPPTEPTSASMTERVSLMSIPPSSTAQRLGLGACCAGGYGAAHSRKRTSVAAIGSTYPVHQIAGIMQSSSPGPCVIICCAARVRFWTPRRHPRPEQDLANASRSLPEFDCGEP